MKRIKTLLIFSLVIALSFSLFGCKLLPQGDSAVEETATIAVLPQWLTLAHRAEAAEEGEEVEEGEATAEEGAAPVPAQAATTQPATTQPATTESAQQTEQPAKSSGTPKWEQPGNMEYVVKIRLDEAVRQYKRLLTRLNNTEDKGDKDILRNEIKLLKADIDEVAEGLGLNLQKEYGITAASSDSSGSGWLEDWDESPSGFAD